MEYCTQCQPLHSGRSLYQTVRLHNAVAQGIVSPRAFANPATGQGTGSAGNRRATCLLNPRSRPLNDMRSTCAKLCRESGGDLEQIQFLLGHASIQTTERYLGSRQNLKEAVNDRLGLD